MLRARVVRGVTPGAPGYLEFCEEGEPGQLVCRGGFLMSGYVGDEAATARAIACTWSTCSNESARSSITLVEILQASMTKDSFQILG